MRPNEKRRSRECHRNEEIVEKIHFFFFSSGCGKIKMKYTVVVQARRIAIVVYYLPYFDFSIVQFVLFSPSVVDRIAKMKRSRTTTARIRIYVFFIRNGVTQIEFRIRCEAVAAIDHIVADLIHDYRHIIPKRIVS